LDFIEKGRRGGGRKEDKKRRSKERGEGEVKREEGYTTTLILNFISLGTYYNYFPVWILSIEK
jgi:hypothetical protein